jgi:hypothetical protein
MSFARVTLIKIVYVLPVAGGCVMLGAKGCGGLSSYCWGYLTTLRQLHTLYNLE